MSKHTPEPWKVWDHDGDACIEALIIEPDIYGDISTSLSFANASRIVACVNACAGMETAELESMSIKKLLGNYQAEVWQLVEKNKAFKADADRLAEELHTALDYVQDFELLRDARAMVTQYVWMRHRWPYPAEKMKSALAAHEEGKNG
jgi:hypothetical protein